MLKDAGAGLSYLYADSKVFFSVHFNALKANTTLSVYEASKPSFF
jgi:hypothetical protein